MAFLLSSALITETIGRMVGIGILGASLGLCIVAAESFLRAAVLEVTWAPNEVTTITLGKTPITIGGGDDHIYVSTLPPGAIQITMHEGVITCSKYDSKQPTQLKNGSEIQIGTISARVKATS